MVKSLLGQAIKSLFIDAILEIVYFPVWRYSAGLKNTILYSLNGIKNANNNLALIIMFKRVVLLLNALNFVTLFLNLRQ